MLAEARNNIFADCLSSIKQLLTETVINNHPGGRVEGRSKGRYWGALFAHKLHYKFASFSHELSELAGE